MLHHVRGRSRRHAHEEFGVHHRKEPLRLRVSTLRFAEPVAPDPGRFRQSTCALHPLPAQFQSSAAGGQPREPSSRYGGLQALTRNRAEDQAARSHSHRPRCAPRLHGPQCEAAAHERLPPRVLPRDYRQDQSMAREDDRDGCLRQARDSGRPLLRCHGHPRRRASSPRSPASGASSRPRCRAARPPATHR